MRSHASAEAMDFFGQSAASTEPCEGSLDDPAAGQHLEALGRMGTLDDLHCPVADLAQGAAQLGSGISAVEKDMTQPRESLADGFQHIGRTIPIPDVGAVNQKTDQRTKGIGDDMALAPLDLFTRLIAANTAAFSGFHTLAVDNPVLGLASRPSNSRVSMTS